MKSRLFGSIFGHCTGDALGLPVEFRSRLYLKDNPVISMLGYGTHNQPMGTWSDDSSMMLCTLESLCEGYSLKDLADRLVSWYVDGYWTPHGDVFDIGETTRIALELLKRGLVGPGESGVDREDANGNGALVRMLPLAWAVADSPVDRLKTVAGEVTRITHGHPRAVLASWLYLLLARQLIAGNGIQEAYCRTCDLAAHHFGSHPEIEHFRRFIAGGLARASEREIESTGYCVHSLEAAVWSLLQTGTFSEAVITAVNLGGDTDSIGAITGGLAGIHYGAAAIPGQWIRVLPKNKEIMKLALRYVRVFTYAQRV